LTTTKLNSGDNYVIDKQQGKITVITTSLTTTKLNNGDNYVIDKQSKRTVITTSLTHSKVK